MSVVKETLGLALCLMGVSACNDTKPTPQGDMVLTSQHAALPTMEHIALTANRCWFKSRDGAFKSYRLAPELQSFSGKPRILLVAYNNPAERPLLVIEAMGNPAKVAAYGPLMYNNLGGRIAENVKRWTAGDNKC